MKPTCIITIKEIPPISTPYGSIVPLFKKIVRKSGCKMSNENAVTIIREVGLTGESSFFVIPRVFSKKGIYAEVLIMGLIHAGFKVVRSQSKIH
jgi:hypothetical protein